MASNHEPIARGENTTDTAWHRAWPWIVIAAMTVASTVLGYVGFAGYAASTGSGDGVTDLLYRTLQLFVLESGYLAGDVPWQLEIARWLAPLVPAWAILQALRVLFRDQRESFWLRRRRDHVVICGLGRRGLQFVRDFRGAGDDVVVIEQDADNPRLPACRRTGARVLIGSCTDAMLLRKARVERACHAVLVTGDDGTNVETAILVRQVVGVDAGDSAPGSRCYVHVVDLELSRQLEKSRLLSAPAVGLRIRIFNSYQDSARSMLRNHPLEPAGFDAGDPRQVHLVVFGFGQMGEAVVVQAAKLGHFANGRPLRITVIDRQAERLAASFESRYPGMGDIDDLQIEFIQSDSESSSVLAQLKDWADDPGAIVTIAVCFDGDSPSLTCALNIKAALDPTTVPVHVRMSEETGLATLLADRRDEDASLGGVVAFGTTSTNATRDLLLNRKRDELARAFHLSHLRKRASGTGEDEDLGARIWDELGSEMKDSNRQEADHLEVKLRVIGCHEATADLRQRLVELEAGEVEVLARMEHARWCAERFIDGWRRGAMDKANKIHGDLVPWSELGEGSRDYNRRTILELVEVLEMVEAKLDG
jgi:voltage-gated potassium channel Kch